MCGEHHHDAHHHGHHAVHDVHHHAAHVVADHNEISRLNNQTGELIAQRAALRKMNTKTEQEINQLKEVEGELRNNVDELLKEMEDKERSAKATNEELKENIAALSSLLESRTADLAAEIEKTAELQVVNDEITAKAAELAAEKEKVDGELAASKADNLAKKRADTEEVHKLDVTIAELCGLPCPPLVYYHC